MINQLLENGWQPCQLSEDDNLLKTIGRFKIYGSYSEPFLLLTDTATNQTIGLDCQNLDQKKELKKITSQLNKYYPSTQQLSLWN
jgi:hypothetical protein